MTTTEFADYELHLEYQASTTTNSGVFLRTKAEPTDPAADCYEVNIAPADNPFPTGSLVARQKAMSPAVTGDDWHTLEIRVEADKFTVRHDDVLTADYLDPQPRRRGYVGLHFREGKIAFRNLRLRPLGGKAIFSGADLEGWNTDRIGESKATVRPDGELQMASGPGQLESNDSYGDFVLQLECFVDGEGLNSGVFFRSIPRDAMMGYECQIHNGVVDGDPTKPADCGTGGFYRRSDARLVKTRDREWFALTLAANGPHMAAWANGIQVSDWTDDREPDENPRRGLRLAPGTLILQGHDPTTNLRFRKIRIAETGESEPGTPESPEN
jgi:hypothetical protein